MHRRPWTALLLMALVPYAAGCTRGPTPVRGLITLDGRPVQGATVTFLPEGPGNPAHGWTDAEGEFRLSTFQPNDGALPGSYRVVVRYSEPASLPTNTSEEAAMAAANSLTKKKAPRYLIPSAYDSAATTPIKQTVPTSEIVTIEMRTSP